MRVRYEQFGGIIALDKPPSTVYVDREYMKRIGYENSPLWDRDATCLSAPVTVHFAVTHKCPARCSICYNASSSSRSSEVSTDEAKSIIRTLSEMGVFTIAFGGGEPLSRPDIFELAQEAKKLGIVPT